MTHDIVITPRIAPEQTAQLNQLVQAFNRGLDNAFRTPQPLGTSGVLEDLGMRL